MRVAIDDEGNLAEPQPNRSFALRAEQTGGNRVSLLWYYSPLEQASKPAGFNVYGDGGTHQIDFGNPLASIEYRGRRFYRYESDSLDAGAYCFCVRSVDAAGVEGPPATVEIQLDAQEPQAVEVVSVEVI